MKAIRHWKIVLTILPIVSLILIIGGAAAEKTFLQSTGFESKSSLQKSPAGWDKTIVPKFVDFVDFIWDPDTSYKGENSISIEIHKDHPGDQTVAYNWYADVMNYEPGKEYELSCWVKGKDLKETAWICVQCWDESMSKMLNFATTQKDYELKGTFDWKQVGTVFTVPEGTQTVIVRAGIAAPGNNGGRVWFDELHIKELDGEDR
jgi:hypothetical protein